MKKLDSNKEDYIFPKFHKGQDQFFTFVRIKHNDKHYLIPVIRYLSKEIKNVDYQMFIMECYNVLILFKIPEEIHPNMSIYEDVQTISEEKRIMNAIKI